MAPTNLQYLLNLKRLREFSGSKHRLHSMKRRLCKRFGKSLGTRSSFIKYDPDGPMSLSQCAILRSERVNVDEILLLHKLYKYYQKIATETLGHLYYDHVNSINSIKGFEEYAKGRFILRTGFKERLISVSQLLGIVECGQNVEPDSLQLHQQIFQAQGVVNEGEIDMLAGLANVPWEVVEDWFEATQEKHRLLLPYLVRQWRQNRAILRFKRIYQKPPTFP